MTKDFLTAKLVSILYIFFLIQPSKNSILFLHFLSFFWQRSFSFCDCSTKCLVMQISTQFSTDNLSILGFFHSWKCPSCIPFTSALTWACCSGTFLSQIGSRPHLYIGISWGALKFSGAWVAPQEILLCRGLGFQTLTAPQVILICSQG